jgi:hypothetical protein
LIWQLRHRSPYRKSSSKNVFVMKKSRIFHLLHLAYWNNSCSFFFGISIDEQHGLFSFVQYHCYWNNVWSCILHRNNHCGKSENFILYSAS